jgi:hypothetical protein
VVTAHSGTDSFKETFALDQQVGKNVVLTHLSQLHKNYNKLTSSKHDRILIDFKVNVIIQSMQERGYSVDLDTSLKKYPLDKYYDNHELAQLTTNVFKNKTIDYSTKSRPSKKTSKHKKKSLMSTKTMTSSRARGSSRNNHTLVSITPDNFRAFTKEEVAG